MISTSEGTYFKQSGADPFQVRIWAAPVDTEYVSLHVSGHDLHDGVDAFIYLQPEDAGNLIGDMQAALALQERWAARPDPWAHTR